MIKPHIRRQKGIRAALGQWPDCWACGLRNPEGNIGVVTRYGLTPVLAYETWLRWLDNYCTSSAGGVRQTRDGLQARYDTKAHLWRYYRWVDGKYIEAGSTRRYKDD